MSVDEFWKFLQEPAFVEMIKGTIKVVRRRNGLTILATQSPRDVLDSPISSNLIGQAPTQIYMPDDKARREDYVDGMGLTEAEYRLVLIDLASTGYGRFLLKQGNISLVCDNNLEALPEYVAVLSSRDATIAHYDRICARRARTMRMWWCRSSCRHIARQRHEKRLCMPER